MDNVLLRIIGFLSQSVVHWPRIKCQTISTLSYAATCICALFLCFPIAAFLSDLIPVGVSFTYKIWHMVLFFKISLITVTLLDLNSVILRVRFSASQDTHNWRMHLFKKSIKFTFLAPYCSKVQKYFPPWSLHSFLVCPL